MKQIFASCMFAAAACLTCCGDDDDDDDDQDQVCSDAACYAQCLETDWLDEAPSWMKREARCVSADTCSCDEYCDDELCTAYCQEEEGQAGGACFIVCLCESDTDTQTDTETDSSTD